MTKPLSVVEELEAIAGVLQRNADTMHSSVHRDSWHGYAASLRAVIERLKAREAFTDAAARPRIVCLCGSTRFWDYFHQAGWQFTLDGLIVLTIGVAKHVTTDDGGHVAEALGPGVAERLDELHLRKIDLADRVFVLNVGGYIGESTRNEIEYAEKIGKPVMYLEPIDAYRAMVKERG